MLLSVVTCFALCYRSADDYYITDWVVTKLYLPSTTVKIFFDMFLIKHGIDINRVMFPFYGNY